MPSDTSIPKSKKPGFIPAVSDVDMLKDKLWLEDPVCPSWAVFHARKLESSSGNPDLSAMLPIWRDDSKSPATIKRLLNIFIQAIEYLNPGQTSVIGFD